MEKKFSQIDEKGARSRKTKDGHVVDNYRLPGKDSDGHKEIYHGGKTYVSSGKTGTDIRNRNAPAHHYVAKEKITDPKSKYHGQEVEKGLWVNQLGRVIEEDMKKFSDIVEGVNYQVVDHHGEHVGYHSTAKKALKDAKAVADNTGRRHTVHQIKNGKIHASWDVHEGGESHRTDVHEGQTVNEDTVHLAPHGTNGTHYRVVKPVHTLKKGEVLSDTEVDDLHDSGFKVKHLKQ